MTNRMAFKLKRRQRTTAGCDWLASASRGRAVCDRAHERQVGTVVESLAPGVYEVEFINDAGKAYASLSLHADQLMRLLHEPSHQAA
jgi:hypothetical protein